MVFVRTPLNASCSPLIVRDPWRHHAVPPTVENLRCVPFCVLLQQKVPEDGLDQETQAALQAVHGIEAVSCQLFSWSWHIRLKSTSSSKQCFVRVEGTTRKLDYSSRVSDGFSLLRDGKASSFIRAATLTKVYMIAVSESYRFTPLKIACRESQNCKIFFVIAGHQL